MNICCLFSYADANQAMKNSKFKLILDIGPNAYDENGNFLHRTYTWDKGGREVRQCQNCGAFFIYQWTDYHGLADDYSYKNYFLVKDLDEAILLNRKFNGQDLEFKFEGLQIWNSDNKWVWNKDDYKPLKGK